MLQNQIASAGGLIGKFVTGLDGLNDSVDGLVTAVRVEGDDVFLELDTGKKLSVDRVTQIFDEVPGVRLWGPRLRVTRRRVKWLRVRRGPRVR